MSISNFTLMSGNSYTVNEGSTLRFDYCVDLPGETLPLHLQLDYKIQDPSGCIVFSDTGTIGKSTKTANLPYTTNNQFKDFLALNDTGGSSSKVDISIDIEATIPGNPATPSDILPPPSITFIPKSFVTAMLAHPTELTASMRKEISKGIQKEFAKHIEEFHRNVKKAEPSAKKKKATNKKSIR